MSLQEYVLCLMFMLSYIIKEAMMTLALALVVLMHFQEPLRSVDADSSPRVEIVHNNILPESMRIGRYLHPDQRLFEAYGSANGDASANGDTVVITWEIRSAEEVWWMRFSFGDSHGDFTDLDDIYRVEVDSSAPFPQFRRLVIATTDGTPITSVSMLSKEKQHPGGFQTFGESWSHSVVNYATIDIH